MTMSNNSDNRPLSPHLSVYKLPLTAVLSISHRLSGVALFVGTFVLAWGIIIGIFGKCNCILPLFSTTLGQIVLALWSLALFYHLSNGIRHLFWDMGKGLDLKTAKNSNAFVIISSIALTAISWFLVL